MSLCRFALLLVAVVVSADQVAEENCDMESMVASVMMLQQTLTVQAVQVAEEGRREDEGHDKGKEEGHEDKQSHEDVEHGDGKEYHEVEKELQQQSLLAQQHKQQLTQEPAQEHATQQAGENASAANLTPHAIPIPCWTQFRPCGEVAYGETVHHPLFGAWELPRQRDITRSNPRSFNLFVLVAAVFIGGHALSVLVSQDSRKEIVDLFEDGDYPRADDDFKKYKAYYEIHKNKLHHGAMYTEAVWKERCDSMKAPESSEFIAPGNIYRALAVLTPDNYFDADAPEPPTDKELSAYGNLCKRLCLKALIVAQMQLSLPAYIFMQDFNEWELTGVKAPLWFVFNPMALAAFMTIVTLFLSFAGKCVISISEGARANYFIISHFAERGRDPHYFWAQSLCVLSLVLNVCSSMMLQACMAMKVSTYTGDMVEVTICATALYFVFDLDEKVMQTNPSLKDIYRRNVFEQIIKDTARRTREEEERQAHSSPSANTASIFPPATPILSPLTMPTTEGGQEEEKGGQKEDHGPYWLLKIGGGMCLLVQALTPIYIFLIVVLQWQNLETGHVIGGSPF